MLNVLSNFSNTMYNLFQPEGAECYTFKLYEINIMWTAEWFKVLNTNQKQNTLDVPGFVLQMAIKID